MMTISIWPILAAGFANVIIGWIWYHPKVFGTTWMRLSNITPEMAERGKKRMAVSVLTSFAAAAFMAWVLNSLGAKVGIFDMVGAIVDLALWCWLGFVVPIMLGSVLWEQRPLKLFFINVSYWLVSLVVMASILFIGSQALTPSYETYDGGDTHYLGE